MNDIMYGHRAAGTPITKAVARAENAKGSGSTLKKSFCGVAITHG